MAPHVSLAKICSSPPASSWTNNNHINAICSSIGALRLRALWECNHHPSPHFSSLAFAKNNEVLFQQVIQCSVSATLSAVTCKVLHPYLRPVPQHIFPLVDLGCRDLRTVDHAWNMKCYLKCLPFLLPLLCFPLWLCTKAHWYYSNCLLVFKNLPRATLVRWEKKIVLEHPLVWMNLEILSLSIITHIFSSSVITTLMIIISISMWRNTINIFKMQIYEYMKESFEYFKWINHFFHSLKLFQITCFSFWLYIYIHPIL